MKPVSALTRSVDTLVRNPIIVAIMFAFTLLSSVTSGVQIIHPLLVYASMGLIYLLLPFLIGGLVGVIADGLRGSASFDRFVSAGTSNYLGLLVGGFALGVVTFILYFVVGIVFAIFAVFVVGLGSASGLSMASILVVAVAGFVALLIVLFPWFLAQFFPAAMVIDDEGIADSFRRSFGLVRSAFLSVIGFDAIAFLISLVAQIPTVYVLYRIFQSTDFQSQAQTTGMTIFDLMSATELALFFGMSLATGTVVGSVLYTYYVAFYDELVSFTDDVPRDEGEPAAPGDR